MLIRSSTTQTCRTSRRPPIPSTSPEFLDTEAMAEMKRRYYKGNVWPQGVAELADFEPTFKAYVNLVSLASAGVGAGRVI